ncbi:hypothetical protein J6590_074519 [Homalodisca vitripennis]|nr:hypothetical protein J6590_074519 [Homalodisca vitripennis]
MTECTGIPALQHRARSVNNTMTTSRDVCLAHSTVIPSSWTTLYVTGRSSIKETLTVFERNCVNCKWEDLILISLNLTQKNTVKVLKVDRIHRYFSAPTPQHDRLLLSQTAVVLYNQGQCQIRNRLPLSQTAVVLYNQGQCQIRNRLPLSQTAVVLYNQGQRQIRNRLPLSQTAVVLYNQGQCQIRNRLPLSQTTVVLYNQGQCQIRNRLPLSQTAVVLYNQGQCQIRNRLPLSQTAVVLYNQGQRQIRNRLLLSQTSVVLYNQGQRQIRNRLPLKPSSIAGASVSVTSLLLLSKVIDADVIADNNSTEPECGPKDSVHQRPHILGRI